MQLNRFLGLRAALGALALLIGAGAVWTLAAQIISPGLPYFPTDSRTVQAFSDARASASAAAAVGMARGDLATTAAVAQAAPLLFSPPEASSNAATRAGTETARRAAERAVRSAPHDARNWLVLAGLAARSSAPDSNAADLLKLSYYTGPNEFSLAPLRLLTAAAMAWDEELQSFVQLEIERIVLQRPDLKPAIVAAYRAAKPEARQFIEGTLKPVDPALLSTLRSNAP